MKNNLYFVLLATLALVGCGQSPTTNKKEETVAPESLAETDSIETFMWPDSIVHIVAADPQECYFDKTFATYAADTAFYAYEESCIEEQLCFVASRIQPMKLPVEWKADKKLSDMVELYNYMAILHAIETDFDAYVRYTTNPGDMDEEEQKAVDEGNTGIRKAFFAELDRINMKSLSNKEIQNSIRILIGKIKDQVNSGEETEDDNMWDISGIMDELVVSWLPDLDQVDIVELYKWTDMTMPNYYLPKWAPDVFEQFLGEDAEPTIDDEMNIIKCFDEAENFNEKAAWGFVALRVHNVVFSTNLLQNIEKMFASGCYSPLLDPLWRAYRVEYNNTYSCHSSYCYSPNLRYNHFRRMMAYVTLRHIEAHPEDELARLQYYYIVMHTDILRVHHPYPYGNSSAFEAIMIYWNKALLDY